MIDEYRLRCAEKTLTSLRLAMAADRVRHAIRVLDHFEALCAELHDVLQAVEKYENLDYTAETVVEVASSWAARPRPETDY